MRKNVSIAAKFLLLTLNYFVESAKYSFGLTKLFFWVLFCCPRKSFVEPTKRF